MSQNKAQLLNPINGNINVSGVVTAAQFVGGGGGVGSLDGGTGGSGIIVIRYKV